MKVSAAVVCLTLLPALISAVQRPSSGCQRRCGSLQVPYPFGLTEECAMTGFHLNCNKSEDGTPKAFYRNIEVLGVSLAEGTLRMSNKINSVCYNASSKTMVYSDNQFLNLMNTSFKFSYLKNKFTVLGCKSLGFIRDSDMVRNFMTGCLAMCRKGKIEGLTRGLCGGIGCCQSSIPKGLQFARVWFDTNYNLEDISYAGNCSYAVLMDSSNFVFNSSYATSPVFYNANDGRVPVVVDWSFGNKSCEVARKNNDTYVCISKNSNCLDSPSGGYICKCSEGFKGNPYLLNGCQDIDECAEKDICPEICVNHDGGFTCKCRDGGAYDALRKECKRNSDSRLIGILIGVGAVGGFLFLCLMASIFVHQWRKYIKNQLQRKYFRKNHDLLLQEIRLSGHNATDNIRIFSYEEMEKATNSFDHTRVLGEGGHGTVYKGILSDQSVVAIKKPKKAEESETKQSINEVVLLSQLNHRHIINLVGCCLEVEGPLLVYEFVSNGCLSRILHDPSKDSLSWDDCLRVAAEAASAFHYIHSEAGIMILHRDVKSDNILLDGNNTVKIADFGISKFIPVSQTSVSTDVKGTYGYLDPYYYENRQLNQKSDVYSFGVVLLELLIRKPARFSPEPGIWTKLSFYFLEAIKTRKITEILAPRVVMEASEKHIYCFASLVERCLSENCHDRPTMQEIEWTLTTLQKERLISQGISKETRVNVTDLQACYRMEEEFMASATFSR